MNNEMNRKKMYLIKLSSFLSANKMIMSGKELAEHLNRNDFLTSYNTEYEGGRGIYKLIKETYNWSQNLGLESEAKIIAETFVNENGEYSWE